MPPAATMGGQTSHGTPLFPGPGSHNVMFGGRPAWRAYSDSHACPLSEGVNAHVGGVVLKGSAVVFINNLPAVRMGDLIVEVGPSNAITSGESKVIIR